ncbi:MAG: response regulator transcription factor [Burkholderiales bacterium]
MRGELERGRECFGRRAWAEAWRSLSLADQAVPLRGEDLQLLAQASYMTGRDDDYLRALVRAHDAHLNTGAGVSAVRCAFWLGLSFLFRGETGQATGWLARAQRLLERQNRDCVEHGYLLLPVVEQQIGVGESEAAYATATSAAEIGVRFAESDLSAMARHQQGRIRIQQGRVGEGLALLDEAMVAVTADALSPLVTGLIYCSVIEGCQQVYALGRAREWTTALAHWCDGQPEMVAFTGICRVHRSEIMQLLGAWSDAFEEARRACAHGPQAAKQQAAGLYQQAEVHRLRGEFGAAEQAYRSASQCGGEPQPGLALLRLAQQRTDAAAAAIRRVLGATTDRLQRVRLLPACGEIMLAAGDVAAARAACAELEAIAQTFDTGVPGVLAALAAQARGAVELADGRPEAALGALRCAWSVWQQVEAPYAAARVRVLMGLACRAIGDDEGSELELDAARTVFEQLGAAPDTARVAALMHSEALAHGLSPRELQVLRMVATGKSNKAIANALFLSVKTIDRHLSNIFTKLDLRSRAAATAYAYEHKLV